MQERSTIIDTKNLIISLPQQSSFSCYGDRILIGQAIANLLHNAIRFCVQESRLDISLAQDNKNTVTVFNQGPAIPDFALAKLYDRFFSLPPAEVVEIQSKSTGLGLSFVKEIMKLHKGTIEIKNITQGVQATLRW